MIRILAIILLEKLLVHNVLLAPTTFTYLTAPTSPTLSVKSPDSEEPIEIGYEELEHLDLGVCGVDSYEDNKFGCIELRDDNDSTTTTTKRTPTPTQEECTTQSSITNTADKSLDSFDFKELFDVAEDQSQTLSQGKSDYEDLFSFNFGNQPVEDAFPQMGLKSSNAQAKKETEQKLTSTNKFLKKITLTSKRPTSLINTKSTTAKTSKPLRDRPTKRKIEPFGKKKTTSISKGKTLSTKLTTSTAPKTRKMVNIQKAPDIITKIKGVVTKSNKGHKKSSTPRIQRNRPVQKLNQKKESTTKNLEVESTTCGASDVPTQSTFVVWSAVRRLRSDFLRCDGKTGCKPFDLS